MDWSKRIEPNPPLYAFWPYSAGFGAWEPLLGSEVMYMHEDGRVETKGYGPGYLFTPILILPKKEGAEMHVKLKKVFADFRTEFSAQSAALHTKYENLARAVAPDLMARVLKK